MNTYRMANNAAYFTAGSGAYSSAITPMTLNIGKDILQRSYDALSHLWEMIKAGWVHVPSSQNQPTVHALLEHAYSQRLKMVTAYPSLANVLTMEVAAKAAHIVMAGQKLDSKAVLRLSRLAQSPDNWDGEGAKAMSISSLANFTSFLEKFDKAPRNLELFLGFYGEIVTSWLLPDGSTLDMSFGEHEIELATDQYDEVFTTSDTRLYSLLAEL